ncbi:putative ribosome-binding factor A, mitochondrial [Fukomys damarensis]|uniref:Putative ribosome-binding factor A, mitochondrial n=1 Tax=Fukomys damarensis TaxID=885580 RepID=A0A091CPG4_FUKDA|nr:putative ribosome-binding factor A, mitochondrial [Fukomys damarensis]KFO19488.1 Putative ribosome-binding factor A, mitochondrial [Fukomys damarensis]
MWAAARRLWGLGTRPLALWVGDDIVRLLGPARGLRGSTASYGNKNLLKKFASKTRKKFWYEGPSLGSHLTYKPSKLESLLKATSKKTRKEDYVRLRALNGLLYKALTDLLSTPEVNQEVYDLNVELSKVSLTSDFSACRVYWKTSLSADQNKHTEATLQRNAAYMRHLLMSQQTLRNVPPIVFVQDRRNALLAEVDQLLEIADFGPVDEIDNSAQHDFRSPDGLSSHDPPGPATYSHLSGIDHDALNKQIMEYKRKNEKGLRDINLVPPGQEQMAKLPQWVRKRRKAPPQEDQDISPRSFLLGEESEDEDEDGTLGYGYESQEGEEWEAEPGGGGTQQDFHGRTEQG